MENYQRILCATDFSENCRTAAERAVELATRYGSKLILLHVVEYFPQNRSNEILAPEDIDPAAFREQQAHRALADLARELGCAGAEQAVRFTGGSASRVIVGFGYEQTADLIIMATHGRHGVRHILGATAYGVVHGALCDVLAVRATV